MPIGKYFHGHGDEVMSDMARRYGPEKGKRVFYATANKRGEKPQSERPSMRALKRHGRD